MKRLGRWLFNLAMVVSGVASFACAGFWVRTYFACDQIALVTSDEFSTSEWVIAGPVGVINLGRRDSFKDLPPWWQPSSVPSSSVAHLQHSQIDASPDANLFGIYSQASFRFGRFMYFNVQPGPGDSFMSVRIPCWFAILSGAMAPAAWITRRRRVTAMMNARLKHLCPTCGYDLRATPDRCPECGTIAKG